MFTIETVISRLKTIEPQSPALKQRIEELEAQQKNQTLEQNGDPEVLRESQLVVVRHLLQLAQDQVKTNTGQPISIHYTPQYIEAVRYWKAVRGISLKEAAQCIINVYSTL